MIGVTQLLATNLAPSTLGTEDNPFTSHSDVASSGLSNGFYYFDDGTRTRQYYFDVDGSESNAEGGWARWDPSWATWYYGRECSIADVSSDGLIDSKAGASNYTSSEHSGCGIWSNALFKCQYITFSDVNLDGTSYASYPPYVRLCDATSDNFPTVSGTDAPQPAWEYYYPGRQPPGAYSMDLLVIKRSPYYTDDPHPNTVSNHNYQNGTTPAKGFPFVSGYKYNLGTIADRKLWTGGSDYSGTYADGYQPAKRGRYKVWFKF